MGRSFFSGTAPTTTPIPGTSEEEKAAVARLLHRLHIDDPEVAAMLGVAA